MTDLITILDISFLEFLQERLARLFKGKVSVVFEDLQSRPITGKFPKTRVFAARDKEKGGNVCKDMIDCPWNEKAQLKCLLSDAEGAHMARTHKKGYLYRCHQGRGFPNFLFPITIWPYEVIGYLYVGQIVFQKLKNTQRERFLSRLKESKYIIESPERFVSEWTESDLLDFYEYIIGPELRRRCSFDAFSKCILNQEENYGLSPEEFFDIVELVERLANELSTLGNSLYMLNSLAELEEYLPPILKTKYDFALFELRSAIRSAVTQKKGVGIDVDKTVETIRQKFFEILTERKKYEDKYLEELIEPYRLGIVQPSENIQRQIVEFYARCTTYEAVLYSKIRTMIGLKTISQPTIEKGDELMYSFFNVLASCAREFPSSRELAIGLFLQMYREKDVKILLKHRFVPCMRLLFEGEQELRDWLVDNGIVDLDIKEYEEKLIGFSRTFDLIVEDLKSLLKEFQETNGSLGKGLRKEAEEGVADLGELMDYIRLANVLRCSLAIPFSDDKFGTRALLDLKSYRVFLNSGGLTPTYSAVVNAQQSWLAHRNEEGPIGKNLEDELKKKVEHTRTLVAKLIKAESTDSIVFTSNTTSSIDLVLRGVLKPGDAVLTTDLEHNVVYYLKEHFEEHLRNDIEVVPIRREITEGKEWLSKLANRIRPQTRLIVLSHIPYGACSLLPVKEIVEKCRKVSESRGGRVLFLIDAAHAVGNISVDVKKLDCDFYAFDGHKWLLGPEGTGLLYCKEQYLEPGNRFGVHLPISTAYMVSPKYSPKRSNGKKFELGTNDAARIVSLGEAVETTSKLNFSQTSQWRRHLVRVFMESIRRTRWKILNPIGAGETGMICLQIDGKYEGAIYERIAALLEESNIIVRWLSDPPSVRVCLHHYNNESDVKLAAFHMKALLEGINVHIGNHKEIEAKLTDSIVDFLRLDRPQEIASFVGLNLFSIAGAGKSYVVSHILEELKKKKVLKSYVKIHARDVLKQKRPERKFASIIDECWSKMPTAVFIDEADSLLEEKQKGILGTLNDEYERLKRDRKARIVFITAENDPYKIFQSAARRLKTAYFPLPDFETRLRYLQTLSRGRSCSSKLLLTEIARLTQEYSMSDLKKVWEVAVQKSGGLVLTAQHFEQAFQLVPRTASEKVFQRYSSMIGDPLLRPKLFTGRIEAD